MRKGSAGATACPQQVDHRFGDHQAEVVLQAIAQTIALMVDRVAARAQIDVNLAIAHFDREAVDIVGPEIEGAAASQVKAGVMPVAA